LINLPADQCRYYDNSDNNVLFIHYEILAVIETAFSFCVNLSENYKRFFAEQQSFSCNFLIHPAKKRGD